MIDDTWHATGAIVHENKIRLVTIHHSLLVVQVREWAVAQSYALERDASTATSESARVMMKSIAHALRCWAQGVSGSSATQTAPWKCFLPLAVRAEIGFLTVTPGNIQSYTHAVMQRSVPARRSTDPTFLFVPGEEEPELFVTPDSSHLARFAPDWFCTRVVSKEMMRRLYYMVADDYPER